MEPGRRRNPQSTDRLHALVNWWIYDRGSQGDALFVRQRIRTSLSLPPSLSLSLSLSLSGSGPAEPEIHVHFAADRRHSRLLQTIHRRSRPLLYSNLFHWCHVRLCQQVSPLWLCLEGAPCQGRLGYTVFLLKQQNIMRKYLWTIEGQKIRLKRNPLYSQVHPALMWWVFEFSALT